MSINTHINNWIDRADHVMDYYTLFIKAWIPYNAWYMHNFYDEDSNPRRDRDAAIITHINTTSNRYRDKIQSLLRGSDDNCKRFKELVSNLHFELDSNPIPNYEERIAFSTVNLLRNSKKTHSQNYKNHTYFVEFKDQLPKAQKRWFLEVQKKSNNSTIHRISLHDWSMDSLSNDPDYIALPENEMRSHLRDAFKEINPKKPVVIIVQPKRTSSGKHIQPSNSIVINEDKNLYFTDDIDMISKAIVQILYELRCKLFHGELDPISSNSNVYEFAYYIQKMLIKELR